MFETSGKLDEAFYKKNFKIIANSKRFFYLFILEAVMAVLSIIMEMYIITAVCAFLTVCCVVMAFYFPRRYIKTTVKRMAECGHPDGMDMSSSFGDDAIHLKNESNGASDTMSYEKLKYCTECDDGFILRTEQNLFFVCFIDAQDAEKRASFREFINLKSPKIKWKKAK